MIARHGRFVAAIVIDSLGTGVFVPVSMLYFLATTSLTLVQIGAALTTAGLLALPAGPLVGGLVDRYGAKPVLQAANLAQALGFAGYIVVGQTWQIAICAWLNSAGRAVFFSCYGVTVTALAAPGQRERWFGLLGSVRNLGYALGGLLSAVAVSIGRFDAAGVGEEAADPVGDGVLSFGLAGSAAFDGVLGELLLAGEPGPQARWALAGGEELRAAEVEIALAGPFGGCSQAVAEFEFGLEEVRLEPVQGVFADSPAQEFLGGRSRDPSAGGDDLLVLLLQDSPSQGSLAGSPHGLYGVWVMEEILR